MNTRFSFGFGSAALLALGLLAAAPAHPAAFADFNNDGRSDIFWRNSATGENYLFPMNGTTVLDTEGHARTVPDQNWQVVWFGDFDGDGNGDLLWRNSSTGENYIYLMNGKDVAGEGYIRTVADQNWRIAGVGDFDGDGKADILWRNASTGQNYIYPMDGLAIKPTEGYVRAVADQNWQVAGIGDFNGDLKADILWRNSATGQNYIYPMNGREILPGEGFIRTVADLNWWVAGIGDFNGDAHADILWRNVATGENYLYPMNGLAILPGEGYLRTVLEQAWMVQGTGDYDGDGKADILWRNATTGENYIYPMDGTTIKPTEGYVRTMGPRWRVAAGNTPVVPVPPTSLGTDFHLAFPDHRCVSDPALCAGGSVVVTLRITSSTNNLGKVTFPGGSTSFNLLAGREQVIALPASVVLTSNESVEDKGVRVTALNPVSVHAFVESYPFSEGFLAYPTSRLGTEYVVMTRANTDVQLPGSLFAIVGTRDNTTVTITPAASGLTQPAGVPFDIKLNAGQTYQLINPETGDMAGSRVSATQPVAVFGGHRCVNIPSEVGFCSNLAEQIPDVTRLGTLFHAVPFDARPDYSLRILATQDGTSLTYDPPSDGCATLNAGQFCDVVLTGAMQVFSSKPVLVAQFMHGSRSGGRAIGDPAMGMLTPQEQALAEMRFSVHQSHSPVTGPYLNIVTPTKALANLKLDGAVVDPGVFAPIGTSGYSGGAVPVAGGTHELRGSAPFTALVYEAGQFTSYIYPAATGLGVTNP